MRRYLQAAKITGTKNRDGRLVAKATDGLPFLLVEGMEVSLVPPVIDAPRHTRIVRVSPQDERVAFIWLDGLTDASVAEALVGAHLLVSRDDLALSEEAFACEALAGCLDGWRFVDKTSGNEGHVICVRETAGQALMEVELDAHAGKVHLVPYAQALVLSEDEEARVVTMEVPKGLFDL